MADIFRFDFQNDDIDRDDDDAASKASVEGKDPQVSNIEPQDIGSARPKLAQQELPQVHKLPELLSSDSFKLKVLPSKISYSTVQIPGFDDNPIDIPRREHFDIKAQLMAEDQMNSKVAVVGLSDSDITPHVYEGGFKTWECSVDLANYISTCMYRDQGTKGQEEQHFVELGAGTALPTLVIFDHILRFSTPAWRAVHMSVADFNMSVLECTTLPNMLLTWFFARSRVVPPREGDLEITENLIARFTKDLSDKSIYVSAITGSWGYRFSTLIEPFDEHHRRRQGIKTTILASETLYSPESILTFTEVLMRSLRKSAEAGGSAEALVATKRIYFGVGGGVEEFHKVLAEHGGKATEVWKSKGEGVGRVILKVVDAQP